MSLAVKLKIRRCIDLGAKIATVAIAVIGSFALYYSYEGNQATKRVLEIQLRPILAFEKPRYWVKYTRSGEKKYRSFRAEFNLRNFGKTPAHEFRKINNKVMFVTKDKNLPLFKGDSADQIRDRFLYRKGILELFFKFFETKPKASLEEVIRHFAHLNKNPDLIDNGYLKSEENKLTFKVGGYPDVDEWASPGTMISPGFDNPNGIGRSSGHEVEQLVDNGKNMIVVFVALEYEGIKPGKKYHYFFLGYYDKWFNGDSAEDYPRNLYPFKTWSTRDQF